MKGGHIGVIGLHSHVPQNLDPKIDRKKKQCERMCVSTYRCYANIWGRERQDKQPAAIILQSSAVKPRREKSIKIM